MKTYIVTYEAIPPRNNEALIEALKANSSWARITESTWAVVTEENAKTLRDQLGSLIGPEDRLFVIKSGVEAAWRRVRCKSEWLKKWL